MKKTIKKWVALLLVGVLACTAMTGCEEEKDAATTDRTENTKLEDQKWDSTVYTGLTPADVYTAMDSAEGYEAIIVDGSARYTITRDGDIAHFDIEGLEEGNETYFDYTNNTGYTYNDEKWVSEKAPDDYQLPSARDFTIQFFVSFGMEATELFADDNYVAEGDKYIMSSEFLAQWNETTQMPIHAIVMERNDTKYTFSVRYTRVTESHTIEMTIEFKPTSLTLPTVG